MSFKTTADPVIVHGLSIVYLIDPFVLPLRFGGDVSRSHTFNSAPP